MKSKEEANIVVSFKQNRDKFIKLDDYIANKIQNMLDEKGFFIMSMAHRVKKWESLEGKVRKHSGEYKSMYDLTDLCAARIICYFLDTVDDIAKALEEIFIIDYKKSVNKAELIKATEFGYISLHYICALKPEDIANVRGDVTGDGKSAGGSNADDGFDYEAFEFEVQIKTVLQHTWAEIEHDLGYKSEFGVPRPIRRDFSRIAGLLEIADNQFMQLRDNSEKYCADIRRRIDNNEADDIPIDRVSLSEYMFRNKDIKEFFRQITNETGAECELISPESYIMQLEFLGVETIGELVDMFRVNKNVAKKIIVSKIADLELDIFSSNMVLRFICHAHMVRNNYTIDQIERFVSMAIGDRKRARSQAEAVLRLRELVDETP